MGSIHPTDFIIYDFNKKRLQFEGLFQRPQLKRDTFLCILCFLIPIKERLLDLFRISTLLS